MASLMERVLKTSNSSEATKLSEADYLSESYQIPTQIPILNAALSGSLFGGFEPGITTFAGESKTFKCVGGETEIEVYTDEKIKMTYRELHESLQENPEQELFVKTPSGFAKIHGTCKKNSDTYDVEFSNGYILTAGDEHAFMNAIGEPVTVNDIVPGEEIKTTDNGSVKVESKYNFVKNNEVYDISIDAPHWYTNGEVAGNIVHHNTSLALIAAKAFLERHDDGIVLFLDCEFGSRKQMLHNVGIDIERVAHIPFTDLEELKQETVQQLKQLKKEDNVFILVDSIGNTASRKELTDAETGNEAADMTRAKQMRSFFRMVTPQVNLKKIPFFAINHTYNNVMNFIPKQEMGGGGGPMYASDTVIFVSKAQIKEGNQKTGNQFNLKIEKSRSLKEGSKLPISVSFEHGVLPWSGLFEMASEGGFITMPTKGFYQVEGSDRKYRKKEMQNTEFWRPMLEDPEFDRFIQKKLLLSDLSLETEKENALESFEQAGGIQVDFEDDNEESEEETNE